MKLNYSAKISTFLRYGIKISSFRQLSTLKVYSTLSKTKEPLKFRHGNNLLWYCCGPTVYDSAHIGHASSYVCFDVIKRVLTNYFRINVSDVLNITDIDDKIITKANQENKTITEVSTFYEREFFEDMALLNCDRPSIVLRVTQHIPQIVDYIQKLIDDGNAYKAASGSVYFRTQKFSVKSFFSPQSLNNFNQEDTKGEKEHEFDFALWKSRKINSEPSWESPWGFGRPGWHIECSTLTEIAFGANFDFHSGGKDLIFPHHHNEITQSCAYNNSDGWVTTWLHTGHLHLAGQTKMSKSIKNTISIKELLNKYSSNQFRLFCLLSPYRNDIEFSDEKMLKSVNLLNSLQSFLNLTKAYCNEELPMHEVNIDEKFLFERLIKVQESVHEAFCDDFNTPLVIEEIFQLMSLVNKSFQVVDEIRVKDETKEMNRHYGCIMSVSNYVESIFKLMGINVGSNRINLNQRTALNARELVDKSLKFRKSVRNIALDANLNIPKEIKALLLQACDEIRDDFKEHKIELKDIKGETIWQMKE